MQFLQHGQVENLSQHITCGQNIMIQFHNNEMRENKQPSIYILPHSRERE